MRDNFLNGSNNKRAQFQLQKHFLSINLLETVAN